MGRCIQTFDWYCMLFVKSLSFRTFTFSVVVTFKIPSDHFKLVEKDNYGPISELLQTSYFCRGGDTPKVQMPYQTIPGKIPRKLEIERYVLFVCNCLHFLLFLDLFTLFYFVYFPIDVEGNT